MRHIRQVTEKSEANARIDSFLGKTPPKVSPGAKNRRARYIDDVRACQKRRDWEGMSPAKLVALYWIAHKTVYGFAPLEIDKPKPWERATMAAAAMVRRHFNGDINRAIQFMQWVWKREKYKVKKLKEQTGTDDVGRRITWANQFSHDYLISDWIGSGVRK